MTPPSRASASPSQNQNTPTNPRLSLRSLRDYRIRDRSYQLLDTAIQKAIWDYAERLPPGLNAKQTARLLTQSFKQDLRQFETKRRRTVAAMEEDFHVRTVKRMRLFLQDRARPLQ